MIGPARDDRPTSLQHALLALRADMLSMERLLAPEVEALPPDCRVSGLNLAHYVALRRQDVRELQEQLVALGLSSLGRAEAHVLATVEAVLGHLSRLTGEGVDGVTPPVSAAEGRRLLERRTDALLGARSADRRARILATLPSEAASEPALVQRLLEAGADLVRINCAHDDAAAWGRMVGHVRAAERALGRRCRVLMDLAGPKLRTGPMEPGPQVVTWRPRRDALGRVTRPARVWVTPADAPEPPPGAADATLELPRSFVAALPCGAALRLVDARGAKRRLRVAARAGESVWLEAEKRAYVVPGTTLVVAGGPSCAVGALPRVEPELALRRGDALLVTLDQAPGRAAGGAPDEPARIGCSLPELLATVGCGQRVVFDDGRITARVARVDERGVLVRVTATAREGGEALRADKGINLPDLATGGPGGLTRKDRADLAFVARHADLVGLSFVHDPRDVVELGACLADVGGPPDLGVVVKLETRAAFDQLPAILFAALRRPQVGVMIARGDLAVECGFERLAEAQEEILWLAEAAHVPVIWATQVLEQLTKSGQPSRAEITDAAMAARAECVMLNKGPHLAEAVRALDDVLRRMQDHQSKKRALLRPLAVARRFPAPAHGPA